jgi:hypothetical protein
MPAKKPKRLPSKKQELSAEEASKMAEEVALAALGSGLRIAAALSTVAAKTASLALASMASGADKFAELVRSEASRQEVRRGTNYSRSRPIATRRRRLSRRTVHEKLAC